MEFQSRARKSATSTNPAARPASAASRPPQATSSLQILVSASFALLSRSWHKRLTRWLNDRDQTGPTWISQDHVTPPHPSSTPPTAVVQCSESLRRSRTRPFVGFSLKTETGESTHVISCWYEGTAKAGGRTSGEITMRRT